MPKFDFNFIGPLYHFQEWGNSCPHEFVDAYRLEHDMSWTKEEYIEVKDGELEVINKILHNNTIPRLDFLADAAHEKQSAHHHEHDHHDVNDHPKVEEHFD